MASDPAFVGGCFASAFHEVENGGKERICRQRGRADVVTIADGVQILDEKTVEEENFVGGGEKTNPLARIEYMLGEAFALVVDRLGFLPKVLIVACYLPAYFAQFIVGECLSCCCHIGVDGQIAEASDGSARAVCHSADEQEGDEQEGHSPIKEWSIHPKQIPHFGVVRECHPYETGADLFGQVEIFDTIGLGDAYVRPMPVTGGSYDLGARRVVLHLLRTVYDIVEEDYAIPVDDADAYGAGEKGQNVAESLPIVGRGVGGGFVYDGYVFCQPILKSLLFDRSLSPLSDQDHSCEKEQEETSESEE